ncbi:MAG: hypothetical protein K6G26_07600 [Lachnospiraceae bacterium]|nr:hypothetical protein [Lachnospiraceae bacterium]
MNKEYQTAHNNYISASNSSIVQEIEDNKKVGNASNSSVCRKLKGDLDKAKAAEKVDIWACSEQLAKYLGFRYNADSDSYYTWGYSLGSEFAIYCRSEEETLTRLYKHGEKFAQAMAEALKGDTNLSKSVKIKGTTVTVTY